MVESILFFFFFKDLVNLEVGLIFISMVYDTFVFYILVSNRIDIFFRLLNDAVSATKSVGDFFNNDLFF